MRLLIAVLLIVSPVGLAGGLWGCGSSQPAPVVVVGFDGADFDLLVPWMEAGHLPNLSRFFGEAAIGDLTTVYPILSPVCWTSGATGVNPGKHGIFDFQKTDKGGGDPILEQATNRRANPVWMLLSDEKYRVGVLNVPMTYPPDPVRGKMISGFPFPSDDVVLTYPPEYNDELTDYPIDFLGLNMRGRSESKMLSDFIRGLNIRAGIAEEWIASGEFDFMWLVFTASDKVQHFFWRHMDGDHPNHDPATQAELGDAILQVWKILDDHFGRLLAALPEDARVMIVSDHGFEAIYHQVNMANWIQDTDLPAWLADHATPPLLVTNGLLHYVLDGELAGASDRGEFLDRFKAMCTEFRDPRNGRQVFESVFAREDIYDGRVMAKGPDIVFQETPFYYVTRGFPDSTGVPYVERLYTTSFSGYHRPEGVVAMWGPGIVKKTSGSIRQRLAGGGDFKSANIIDVAPTILALYGQIIPSDMDGRVLDEVMTDAFLAERPPTVGEVQGFLLDRPERVLSDAEKEKLKALPYLQ